MARQPRHGAEALDTQGKPATRRADRRVRSGAHQKWRGPLPVARQTALGNSRPRASGETFQLPQSAQLLKLPNLSLS